MSTTAHRPTPPIERRSFLVRAALAAVAGACICFSMPPWGWWPLAIVGIALWLHVIEHEPRRGRFALGWIVGVTWFGPSTLWMFGLTAAGYPLAVLLGWGPLVGATSLLSPADRRRLIALPAAIVLFEWFHTHAPFGGVPLSMLAMTQTRAPMLGIARLGGALLLGAAVAALGTALYLALQRRWRPALAVVAAVAVLTIVGGLWPIGDPVGSVTIAAVQGGGDQGTRYAAGQEPAVFERHMEATRTIPDDADVDLVLWPENAINVQGAFETHEWRYRLAQEATRIGAPILAGVVEDAPGDDDAFLNYSVIVNPDGTLGDRYDKERRVPFGEYVPLRPVLEPIAGAALPPRDQVPGDGVAVVETSAGPMAVAISWEVFFGRRVREGVRAGGEVVLNPTNGSSYWLTQVQTQQIATSQLRALESGRWLVQVAPTGFSAFVTPDGEVQHRTGVSERKVLIQRIDRYDSTVPAQALGDLPAVLLAVVALAWVYRRRLEGGPPAEVVFVEETAAGTDDPTT
jgi:apolipoprotein N-acyltransferase